MKLTKVIITKEKELKDNLEKIIKLKEIKSNKDYTIHKWERKLFKEEETIILAQFNDLNNTINFLLENYEIFKIIIVWKANNLWNIDLKKWDIVIPNTFIKEHKDPIFIEYVIWENYDLKKFWLLLSWICISWEDKKTSDFIADIKDNNSYNILEKLKENNLLDKTVVLEEIIWSNKDKFKNITNIIELVL